MSRQFWVHLGDRRVLDQLLELVESLYVPFTIEERDSSTEFTCSTSSTDSCLVSFISGNQKNRKGHVRCVYLSTVSLICQLSTRAVSVS
jgi:hypothetical protein